MPASINSSRARSYTIVAELAASADDADRLHLRALLDAFLRAIDAGFFDDAPERPASLIAGSAAWEEDGALVRVRFAAEDLPRASFRILSGMFAGSVQHLSLPLQAASAPLSGLGDLLQLDAPALAPLPLLPFELSIPPEGTDRKQLRVEVDFCAPISRALGDTLRTLFAVWDALALGAFPEPGRPLGHSWIGPTSDAFFITSMEHSSEDFEGGPLAFDVLVRALLRVHAVTPIEHLEIE